MRACREEACQNCCALTVWRACSLHMSAPQRGGCSTRICPHERHSERHQALALRCVACVPLVAWLTPNLPLVRTQRPRTCMPIVMHGSPCPCVADAGCRRSGRHCMSQSSSAPFCRREAAPFGGVWAVRQLTSGPAWHRCDSCSWPFSRPSAPPTLSRPPAVRQQPLSGSSDDMYSLVGGVLEARVSHSPLAHAPQLWAACPKLHRNTSKYEISHQLRQRGRQSGVEFL